MSGPVITAAAQKFMRRMVRFGGQGEAAGFRLTVTAGGCSGYDASFTVEAAPKPGDEAIDCEGVKVFLPAESRILLDGVTVDFADTPTSSGFTFFNPSAGPCGCATSGVVVPAGTTTIRIDAIRRR